MIQLIKNTDGTYSYPKDSIPCYWVEDHNYMVSDYGGIEKMYNAIQKDYDEDYRTEAEISEYKLKNHGKVFTFSIQCQTYAITEKTIKSLIEYFSNDEDSNNSAAGTGIRKVSSIEVSAEHSYKGKKPSDAKTAFKNYLLVATLIHLGRKKEPTIAFNVDSYGCAISIDALSQLLVDKKAKFKLVEV